MRNMLAFLATLTLAFIGTGWYLNWFSVRSVPAQTAGQKSVTVDFDTKKITADLIEAEQKIQQKLDKAKTANSTPVTPSTTTSKGPADLNIPSIDFSLDD